MSSILVVGPSWVGDMVMAQSLFKVLKQVHTDCNIDVLAPAWSKALLDRMPEVRAAIEMPLGHGQLQLGLRYRIGKSLREKHYDQAIVLPNSLKSALIPFWARIPRRTGYVGEMRWGLLNDARKLDRQKLTMTVQRFVALACSSKTCETLPEIPPPVLVMDANNAVVACERLGLAKPRGKLLVLCPGAEYGPAKRWPEEYYAEVAREKIRQGWQVWLFGSDKDHAVCEHIATQAGAGCVNLAGRTSLEDAIDLMSLADAVVSNDSGLMHVAAALQKPLVAVYGSSDPGFTPPLNEQAKVLTLGLSCSPCFKRECPLGHLDCLRKLEPARVLSALEEIAQ